MVAPFGLTKYVFWSLRISPRASFFPLPNQPDLIHINQVFHYDLNCLNVTVWRLQTQAWCFGKRLTLFSCNHTSLIQWDPICISGGNFSSGVVGSAPLLIIFEDLLHLKTKVLVFSSLKVHLAAVSCYHKGIEIGFIQEVFLKGPGNLCPLCDPLVPQWSLIGWVSTVNAQALWIPCYVLWQSFLGRCVS